MIHKVVASGAEGGGGPDERLDVRVQQSDDHENVSLEVAVTEARLVIGLTGFRLRLSKSVTAGAARVGLLAAAAAITYKVVPTQALLVVLVAIAVAPAVFGGPRALSVPRRRHRAGG